MCDSCHHISSTLGDEKTSDPKRFLDHFVVQPLGLCVGWFLCSADRRMVRGGWSLSLLAEALRGKS